MSNLITGLNIGRNALSAQQSALQIVGNNIANVNTPGYSHQKVRMVSGIHPGGLMMNGLGQLSGGVTVEGAIRVRDMLIDRHLRRETQNLGQYETLSNSLEQIESIFNEPKDTGLSSLMSRFFNSWDDLSNNPEDLSARIALREHGATLTNAINESYFRLSQLQQDIGETLQGKVKEINNIAQQIANLNQQIKNTEAAKETANELRDSRDILVDRLSKLVDIDFLEAEDETLTINAGQKNLINGAFAAELEVTVPKLGSVTQASVRLRGGQAVNIRNGELKGLLDAHNDIIPKLKKQLDDLAAGLANEVNELHKTGFGLDGSTGNSFFTYTSVSTRLVDGSATSDKLGAAETLAIDKAIFSDVKKIAASSESDAPSDNSIAMMISQLRAKPFMFGSLTNDFVLWDENTATFSDFYQSQMIAFLGVQSQNANQLLDAQKLVVSQVEQRRESVSGVSLDEEAIDLVNYQSAYQAAARYINTINELLDMVVNRL